MLLQLSHFLLYFFGDVLVIKILFFPVHGTLAFLSDYVTCTRQKRKLSYDRRLWLQQTSWLIAAIFFHPAIVDGEEACWVLAHSTAVVFLLCLTV